MGLVRDAYEEVDPTRVGMTQHLEEREALRLELTPREWG